jgi:hypothetical protein
MEIQGIPSGSSATNTSSTDSTVSGAMGKAIDKIEIYTKETSKNTKDSVNAIKSLTKSLLSKNANRSSSKKNDTAKLTDAVVANSAMLSALRQKIDTKQFHLEIKAGTMSWFNKLLNTMTSDVAISTIDKFSKVFEASVKSLANLDTYSNRIEKLSQSLVGAFGSFKQIGKGLILLSGGLALLGVTLATFMEAVTPADILTFGAILLTLRLAGEISEGATWDFAKLATSIALLGISIWAFTELVDFDMTAKFAGSLLAITGVMWGMSKVAPSIARNSKAMFASSAAIAAMAGSIWIFSKAIANLEDVDLERAGKNGLVLGGLAIVYSKMGQFAVNIGLGAVAGALMGVSLRAMSWGLQSFENVKIDFARGMGIITMIGASALVIGLIGNPVTAGFIGAGILLTGGIGAALWVLAKGLNSLKTVQVTPAIAQNFSNSLLNTISGLTVLGNPLNVLALGIAVPAALALSGATLGVAAAMLAVAKMPPLNPGHFVNFKNGLVNLLDAFGAFVTINSAVALATPPVAGALALSTWLSVKAMNNIATAKPLTEAQSQLFKTSLSNILEAFSILGLKNSAKAIASVPVMTAIAASSMFAKGAIWMVSTTRKITQDQVDNFKLGLTGIVDAYDSLDGWSLPSITAKAGIVIALSGMTLGSATMIRGFQAYDFDKVKIQNNAESLGVYFSGIIDVFKDHEDDFATIERGTKAFTGLTSMTKGLAKTVQSFANLTFTEYETVNGKIVEKGTVRLTPNDLKQVGLSIGSLLNALTSPLANIGSAHDSYSIAGFEVTNPFSNKVQNGIAAMAKINKMLKPVIDAVLAFNTNGVDVRGVKTFNWSLAAILRTISTSFSSSAEELRKTELNNLQNAIGMVNSLNAAVAQTNFANGVGAFSVYTKDLIQVKSAINAINLDKLTRLTMMLGHLAELNRTEGLKALIETFKKFIEEFMDLKDRMDDDAQARMEQQNAFMQQNAGFAPGNTSYNPTQPLPINNPLVAASQQAVVQTKPDETASSDSFDKLYRSIDKLYRDMFGDSQKPIKVVITDRGF